MTGLNDREEAYLKRIYYSNEGEAAYGSIGKLYSKVKRDAEFNISKTKI